MKPHVEIFFKTVIPFYSHLPADWQSRSIEQKYLFIIATIPAAAIAAKIEELEDYFVKKYGDDFCFNFLHFNSEDLAKYDYLINLKKALRFK